jgi:hypothetical protein
VSASSDGLTSVKTFLKKSPKSTSVADAEEGEDFSISLAEVLKRSPAIQAFQRQLQTAREAYDLAARQSIDGEDPVAIRGEAVNDIPHPLLALQKRVQKCEEQLHQAMQVEREHLLKKRSTPMPSRHLASFRSKAQPQVKRAILPRRREPIDDQDSDFESRTPHRPLHPQERRNLHRFDDEERAAIYNSRTIRAEPRSPDSPVSERDRNGYDRKVLSPRTSPLVCLSQALHQQMTTPPPLTIAKTSL